jgi:hypothetical protein
MPGSGLVSGAPRRIPVDLLIGSEDYGIDNARATQAELTAAGFELRYEEIPGWGHCCFQSDRAAGIWTWLSARPLP